jgi:putative colanic acid biosysnthesis UDP-glucose lipid carrier transferase
MARIGELESHVLNAATPGHVFVLRALLFPLIPVLDLAACAFVRGQSFSGRYFLLATLAFLLTSLILDRAQIHSDSHLRSSWLEFMQILILWLLVAALAYGLIELAGLSGLIGYPVLWTWIATTPFLLWAAQRGVRFVICRGFAGAEPQRAVIVGITDVGRRLASRIHRTPALATRVVGYFEDRSLERVSHTERHQIVGKVAELRDYVLTHNINIVYVTIPLSRQRRITDLIDSLSDSTVSIYFVPDLFVFNLIQARIDALGGIPLIAVRESPFYAGRLIAKRLEDLILASVALLLLSPLLLVAALGVKFSSPGPVLFRQLRYGLDGRHINIYKFRTLRVVEDGKKNYTQVTRDDTRVTRFGRLLRRASLDELPQLFNVLEGSMSIVGPRPHVAAVNEQYRRLIPDYMVRHKVRPGITGWAQVNGCRGGDDLDSMMRRIECDLDYLRSWSMVLDLKIILRTAVLILRDREAY